MLGSNIKNYMCKSTIFVMFSSSKVVMVANGALLATITILLDGKVFYMSLGLCTAFYNMYICALYS